MTIKLKPLSEQVIVITGASSGIGLATAMAAGNKGARLVLAARNEDALAAIADEINAKGGEAIYVVADVSDRKNVEKIAGEAIARFGGFDTWINNAGISILGKMEEVSDEDHRRLFDTNFWGIVYGSLAAAAHLKQEGGVIINLGSEVSDVAIPLQGMYSASKHAIKGFTDAFRMELQEERAPVSVTLVKPSAIATPFFDHVRNYTDREPQAPSPVYRPEDVAMAILHAATHPVRDIYVGSGSKVMSILRSHAPRVADWMGRTIMFKSQLSSEPKSHDNDNLYDAGEDGNIYGEVASHGRPSFYTRAAMHPIVTGAVVAGLGAAAYALARHEPPRTRLQAARKAAENLASRWH